MASLALNTAASAAKACSASQLSFSLPMTALKKFSTNSWYLMEVAGFLAFDGGKPRLIVQQAKVEKSGEFQKKEETVNHYEKAKKPAGKKPAPKPKKEEHETDEDLPF